MPRNSELGNSPTGVVYAAGYAAMVVGVVIATKIILTLTSGLWIGVVVALFGVLCIVVDTAVRTFNGGRVVSVDELAEYERLKAEEIDRQSEDEFGYDIDEDGFTRADNPP